MLTNKFGIKQTGENVLLLIVAQNNDIDTNYVKAKIDTTLKNSRM